MIGLVRLGAPLAADATGEVVATLSLPLEEQKERTPPFGLYDPCRNSGKSLKSFFVIESGLGAQLQTF